MAVIQEISARIGRTTGCGVAANIARQYPNWILQTIVGLLLFAKAVNIGADLGAMGDAVQLLVGGPRAAFAVRLFRYGSFRLNAMGRGRPGSFSSNFVDGPLVLEVVAILGTTISLLAGLAGSRENLSGHPVRSLSCARLRRAKAYKPGMAFSNLVALAIMTTAAATLHRHGITDIQTSRQAAEALRPVAGEFAFALFALGIIGTGCLPFRCWRRRPPMRWPRPAGGLAGLAAGHAKPRPCRSLANTTSEPANKLLLAQLAHTYAAMVEPEDREPLPYVSQRQKSGSTSARRPSVRRSWFIEGGAGRRRNSSSPK